MKKRLQQVCSMLVVCAAVTGCLISRFQGVAAAGDAALPVTVILDAGHGGEDGGTTSVSGVQEKVLNLEIVKRLEQLFSFAGVPTVLLRETDTALYTGVCNSFSEKKASDLRNRVEAVQAVPNGLLVSIHQNHFPQEQYAGSQVFYAPTDGSETLAKQLQNSLRDCLDPENARLPKAAGSVYLMNHISCTGVLVECGFLSNIREDQLLQTPAYQMKLSAVICGSVLQFIEEGTSADEI